MNLRFLLLLALSTATLATLSPIDKRLKEILEVEIYNLLNSPRLHKPFSRLLPYPRTEDALERVRNQIAQEEEEYDRERRMARAELLDSEFDTKQLIEKALTTARALDRHGKGLSEQLAAQLCNDGASCLPEMQNIVEEARNTFILGQKIYFREYEAKPLNVDSLRSYRTPSLRYLMRQAIFSNDVKTLDALLALRSLPEDVDYALETAQMMQCTKVAEHLGKLKKPAGGSEM